MRRLRNFLQGEEAATAVEYAVMLAMILLAAVGAVASVGTQAANMWSDNEQGLQSAFSP